MLLKRDTAKLDALTDAVKTYDGNVSRLLMSVGAILDGRDDGYDGTISCTGILSTPA